MLFDLCTKDEGNPFTTKIWVVGSYTDTLLSFHGPQYGRIPLDYKPSPAFRSAFKK